MLTTCHLKLGVDGRLIIPASARRELGLEPGDSVVLESDGTSLLIRSAESVLEETQNYFSQFAIPGVSIVDELIGERRQEVSRESASLA
jgi:AbrB family looped-hinge helix DNA binding protein